MKKNKIHANFAAIPRTVKVETTVLDKCLFQEQKSMNWVCISAKEKVLYILGFVTVYTLKNPLSIFKFILCT